MRRQLQRAAAQLTQQLRTVVIGAARTRVEEDRTGVVQQVEHVQEDVDRRVAAQQVLQRDRSDDAELRVPVRGEASGVQLACGLAATVDR